MYNAISTWVKNSLIDTFASKTELDREFKNELQAEYKNYNNLIAIHNSFAAEENLFTMDIEICGKQAKTLQATDSDEKDKNESRVNVILTNEKGDILKQITSVERADLEELIDKRKSLKRATTPRKQLKTDFTYQQPLSTECRKEHEEQIEILRREQKQDDSSEILDVHLPFRSLGQASSLTDLNNLMKQCPQPQPPLTHKQLKSLQLNEEQAFIMAEQVRKMRTGMERLHDVIKKFRTEKFKQDIDFIIGNVRPAIAKAERIKQLEQTSSRVHGVNKRNIKK